MSTSKPLKRTPHGGASFSYGESKYLLFVLVPPILVLALFVYGTQRDISVRKIVESDLSRAEKSGAMLDLRTLTASFDKRLDRQHSQAWRDVLQSTQALRSYGDEIGMPRDMIRPGSENVEAKSEIWQSLEFREDWAKRAKPILARIGTLVAEAETDHSGPVWQPVIFSGLDTLLPDLNDAQGVMRLLRNEVVVAAHRQDPERAIDALDSMIGTLNAFDWKTGIGSEQSHVELGRQHRQAIADTLSMELWTTDEHFTQLRDQLKERTSVTQRWKAAWKAHYAFVLADLEKRYQYDTLWHSQSPPLPATKHAVLASLRDLSREQIKDENGRHVHVGTAAFAKRLHKRSMDDLQTPSQKRYLSIVATPYAIDRYDQSTLNSASVLANELALEQIERRWVLTAIAAKQFKIKEGRWPNDVKDLQSVGLTRSQSIAVGGSRFKIRSTEKGVSIWSPKLRQENGFLFRLGNNRDYITEIHVQ